VNQTASKSMIPSFLIHVGPHKTGTTSIQEALHQGRAKLATRGIWYPPSIAQAHFPHQHADLAFLLDEGYYEAVGKYLAETAAEAKKRNARLVLLSSEAFYSLRAIDRFSRLLDQAAVHGETQVIYVRRPMAARLRSSLMQCTSGNLGPFASHSRDIDSLIRTRVNWLRARDEYFHSINATIISYDSLNKNAFPTDFLQKATGLRCDFLTNQQQNRTSDKVENGAFLLLSYPIRLLLCIEEKVPVDSPRCYARARQMLGDMQIQDIPVKEMLQQFDQFLISKIDKVLKRSD